MPRQIAGADVQVVCGERLELSAGEREPVERANKTPGAEAPNGEVDRGPVSPDPRPGLRPSSPCRS